MSIVDQLRKAVLDYPTIYALARDCGISQPVLHRFAKGQRDIYLTTADTLCRFFGMKLTDPKRRPPKRPGRTAKRAALRKRRT